MGTGTLEKIKQLGRDKKYWGAGRGAGKKKKYCGAILSKVVWEAFINKCGWEKDEGMRHADGLLSRQRGEQVQRT